MRSTIRSTATLVAAGVLAVSAAAVVASSAPAGAQDPIVFDGSPGVGPAPSTLGPYEMVPFDPDARSENSIVSDVPVPAGAGGGVMGFAPDVELRFNGAGWSPFSSFYPGGAVYCTDCDVDGDVVTLTLPPGTYAFSLYAMPDSYFDDNTITVTAGGVSSPVEVWDDAASEACEDTDDCARYFGFYSTDPATPLTSVTVTATTDAGIGFGNFAISTDEPPAPPTPPTPPAPDEVVAEPTRVTPRFTG